MKTSLVSPIADIASAALSKSMKAKAARVKADRPQQLESVTVYWRGRKMVLMQRPQRRLPALLCKMLRRSWQNLFGTLVRAVGAGAMATAALTAQAHGGHGGAELPTGYQLIDGQAHMWQHRNRMTIKQASESAIFDWQSFSIGAGGHVRFIQNDANAVALNRVLGNDPSVIMGSLTANGKIFLINAAGILVGKSGKIDVAGFTASTLNISNEDFNAGKLNFAADPGKTIGDVQNIGMIKTREGGSVYLIGANVENDGIITAPNGQVLLAAGSMVKLVDTSLPGVSIEVSGVDGKVTNLGQIIASAGTIGIGAALIDNSGIINASSVEKEGGRIFLRATKLLTTDATSKINADGTTGGNVQLYSDQTANIDGDVSALGSAGNGGYVDTSGKTSLSVKYVPRVGPGGEWYIDPYNITIVADSPPDTDVNAAPDPDSGVIVSTGPGSTIHVGTINTALDAGASVTISTGGFGSDGGDAGDITINTGAHIIKTGGAASLFSLQAAHDIIISSNASITDNSSSGLSVQMYAGFDGQTAIGTVQSAGDITMGSIGNLEVQSASFTNTGHLTLGGGMATFSNALNTGSGGTTRISGTVSTGSIYVESGGTMQVSGGSMTVASGTTLNGTVNVSGGVLNTQGITMNAAAELHVSGGTANTGAILVNSGQVDVTAGTLNASSLSIQASGVVNVAGGSASVTGLVTDAGALIASSGSLTMDSLGVDGTMTVSGGVVKAGSTSISGSATVNNTGSLEFTSELSGHGSLFIRDSGHAMVDADTSVALDHVTQSGGTFDVKGNFIIGNLTMSGGQINGAVGKSLTVTNSLAQTGGAIGGTGSAKIDIGSFTQVAGDLVAGNINANTSLVLNAVNGAVSQTAGTSLMSNVLSTTAAHGITLNNAGNNIGAFIASNTQSGNIILNDAAVSLLLNGNIQNLAPSDGEGSGNISITNAGGISATAVHNGCCNINGIDSSGTVELTSTGGNVTLGRINAANLNVSAAAGKIDQEATGTGGLTITGTMTANASSGITLGNAFGTCGSNRIAFFGATNTGSGNITLLNSDGDGVTNRLTKINNLGGNVSVNNNGALETGTDLVNASGTVTIATHSPLTIGAGGVTAGSGVTLTAGDNTSDDDVLTLNGAVQATTGVVTFGGKTIFENAAVLSLAPPVISSPNQPVQGAGYSYSLPPVTPSNLPDNAANNQAANAAATTTDSTVTKTSQTNLGDTTDVMTTPVATTTNSTANTASDQTAGGSAGEFGGGDGKDEKKDSDSKSNKPMPICS
jgi:filamentous hemagglutinin family protein